MAMPKLTICCITYNQEKYISQTLESFLMQKTNFPFEVIIADDCSTDNTAKIIQEYADKYPEIIKPILRKKNLGVVKNFTETLSMAKSEYLIYNEGDDYFTDPLKLQKQVDFLDVHPDFSICFHPVRVFYENGSKEDEVFPSAEWRFKKNVLELEDLIERNFIQTNSCVYRWRFADEENIADIFPKNIMPCDWFLHLLHAQKGKIGFMEDVMSAYRRHSGGVWWESSHNMENLHLKYGLQELNFYIEADKAIAPESFEYFQKKVAPCAQLFFSIYLKNKKYDEISQILKLTPGAFDFKALNKNENNDKDCKRLKRKLKKIIFMQTIIIFALLLYLAISKFGWFVI